MGRIFCYCSHSLFKHFFVDLVMQRWFNKLSNVQSIFLNILLIFVGSYFFYLRNTDQIGFGYFIGIGIMIEIMILNYKKYFGVDNHRESDEEE